MGKTLYETRYYHVKSFQEGTETVLANPDYVFIGWEGKAAMEAVQNCILQKIPYYTGHLVYYTAENYPYFEIINYQ